MRLIRHAATFLSSICLFTLVTGCAMDTVSDPVETSAPAQSSFGELHGSVFGGRQPISGAQVYLFAAGTGATGTASTSLIKAATGTTKNTATGPLKGDYYVTTDSTGSFNLSGDYSCTSGQAVYMYAVGGDPESGQGNTFTNNYAANMAVLGICPGTTLTQISFINLNEVSTVAAAYSFAGFATDALHVSDSGSALAVQGITNAFLNAANLYNIEIEGNSTALATTPNGNGTVPQAEINTLANAIAACTNSTSFTSSDPCATLFGAVKSAGATGTAATDTATFAIYVAQHPATGVATIYKEQPSKGAPYYPTLSAQPTDWTVRLAFTAGGVGQTDGGSPHSIAVDGSGNIYATDYSGNVWNRLSPLGVPASTNGYGNGLSRPHSIAVDPTSKNVWLSNYGSANASTFNVTGAGENEIALKNYEEYTFFCLIPVGTLTSTEGQDAQIDGSGNVWVTADTNSSLQEITGTTVVNALYSYDCPFFATASDNTIPSPKAVAIAPGAAIWVADGGENTATLVNNDDQPASGSPYSLGGSNTPIGAAIDSAQNAWFAKGNGTVSELTSGGAEVTGSPFVTNATSVDGIAIDGSDQVWLTSPSGGSVYELSNAGVELSPTAGYLAASGTQPDGIAIDGSGNVWYNSATDGAIYELVGAAIPVVTPLSYAVAHTGLGARP
jgi:streptogramin lyase